MSIIGGINVNSSTLLQSLLPLRSGLLGGAQTSSSLTGLPISRNISDTYSNTVLSSRNSHLRNSVLAGRPLSIAKGDLDAIKNILENQRQLTQLLSNKSLSKQDSAFLTQQFQDNLTKIDNIAIQKNFRPEDTANIKLISSLSASESSIAIVAPKTGSLAASPAITVAGSVGENQKLADIPIAIVNGTANLQVSGQAILKFSNNNIANNDKVTLNGTDIIAGNTGENGFAVGANISTTISNILNTLNNSSDTKLQQATYSKIGDDAILVTLKGDGINNDFGIGFDIAHGSTTTNISVLNAAGQQTVNSGQLSTAQTIADIGTAGIDTNITPATNGSVALTLSNNNITTNDKITFNGVTFIANGSGENSFAVGATTSETVNNIVNALNANSNANVQKASFTSNNSDTIIATLKNAGTADNNFAVGFDISSATTTAKISVLNASGTETSIANNELDGNANTIATLGTAGTDSFTNDDATNGEVSLRLTNNNITAGDKLIFNNVTFTANNTGPNSFAIGATISETINNIVAALNGSSDANVQKANFTSNNSDTIIATLKNAGGADNNFAFGFNLSSATTTAKISVLNASGAETSAANNELAGVNNTIGTLGTAGTDSVNIAATNGSVSLRLTNNTIADGDSFTFNGVKFTAGGSGATNFTIGTTIDTTIDNLVAKLNASTNANVGEASFARSGSDTIIATLKNAGAAATINDYGIGFNIAQNTKALISVLNADGTETIAANNVLSGAGNTIATIGTAGSADIAATQGSVILNFTGNVTLGQKFTINGSVFTVANDNNGNNFKAGSNISNSIKNLVVTRL